MAKRSWDWNVDLSDYSYYVTLPKITKFQQYNSVPSLGQRQWHHQDLIRNADSQARPGAAEPDSGGGEAGI